VHGHQGWSTAGWQADDVSACLWCDPPSVAGNQALDLGRATLAKIRQNLGWALVYNLVGIPLAAGALLPAFDVSLSPAAAGEAD
jgi:cation transport ATPase